MPCSLRSYLNNAVGRAGDCVTPYVPTVGWGFHTSVCRKHYDMAVMLFESSTGALAAILDENGAIAPGRAHVAAQTFDALYQEDYVRLLALMQTKEAVMDCMQRLASELEKTIGQQKKHPDDLDDRFHSLKKQDKRYIRISRALSYYEQLCFFPSNHVVFSGALTGPNFEWALTQGFMPKDPGAGAEHGDFSHRLQWHAVMRIVTGNFALAHFGDWHKTPLDLFTSLGAGAPQARNLWGVIFDAQGRPNYSDPSNLFRDVKNTKEFGALSTRLEHFYTKRKDVQRACQSVLDETIRNQTHPSVQQYIATLLLTPTRISGLTPPLGPNMVNVVYHWKKTGGAVPLAFNPAVFPPLPPAVGTVYTHFPPGDPNLALWQTYFNQVVHLAANVFWARFINDPSDIGKFLKGSRGTDYVNEMNGLNIVDGVIVSNDEDRLVAHNIGARVAASNTGFNTFVTYNPRLGCTKAASA